MEKIKHTFAHIQEEISSMLSIPDEELTDEQKTAMAEYIAELGEQEAAKVDSFCQFIRLETSRSDAMLQESKRLAARAKTVSNRLDYLRGLYAGILIEHGLKKVQGNVYSITLGKSERVEVPVYTDGLPSEFIRVKVEETREPDKTAIKAAIKEGREVPGCTLKTIYRVQVK